MNFLTSFLKKFFGDKNSRDLKYLMSFLKPIKDADTKNSLLSHDQLRNKTIYFKEYLKNDIIQLELDIKDLNKKINKTDVTSLKEKLYIEIDKINKNIYDIIEKKLIEILPDAFSVLKQTAYRFTHNDLIEVKCTDLDRCLATNKIDYMFVKDDKSVWKTSWNVLGKFMKWEMIHYDVQILGAIALHLGKISEMQTGEGKTLVATLSLYLNALTGRGVHLVTVNDYLAKRDMEWMRPIFNFLGLTVDCIDIYNPSSKERKKAYQSDIVYGTNNEFGFDYLRDNMAKDINDLVQSKLNYAIVDEVDSVLIDDARTPLIISGYSEEITEDYDLNILNKAIYKLVSLQKELINKKLNEVKKIYNDNEDNLKDIGSDLYLIHRGLPKYKPFIKFISNKGVKSIMNKAERYYMQDNNKNMHQIDDNLYFVIDEKNNQCEFTDKGIDFISNSINYKDVFILPDLNKILNEVDNIKDKSEILSIKNDILKEYSIKSSMLHFLNQLLKAYVLFERDIHYVVMDNQVRIVDEQTGRIMEGRRYSDGLHQAIEAKENVKIQSSSQTFATITLQNFFRMYNKLSGMTGTAETEAREFWDIYKLDVIKIPTNKPILRQDKNDLVFKTNKEKYNAIIEEIYIQSVKNSRPVLVGTTSVEVSELLSKYLKLRKIKHNILNAKMHKKEAEIISEAGNSSVVTIATNMAGRGTDIKISDEVRNNGGLVIIGTERHDSRRVDRQLRGRSGRQGDPGHSRFYVSLEDNLMRLFGSERISNIMDKIGHKYGDVLEHSMITKSIERAQKKVEQNNFGIRKRLLEYDNVMNKQREVIYNRRRNALTGDKLNIDIDNIIYDVSLSIVNNNKHILNFIDYELELLKYFNINNDFIDKNKFNSISTDKLIFLTYEEAIKKYNALKNELCNSSYKVISNIYNRKDNTYSKIKVPFLLNDETIYQIICDLQEAYNTKSLSIITEFQKNIILDIIDNNWKRHLKNMDDLRQTSQNAVYEQKDPLVIYKQESFNLFQNMIDNLNKEIVMNLFTCKLSAK